MPLFFFFVAIVIAICGIIIYKVNIIKIKITGLSVCIFCLISLSISFVLFKMLGIALMNLGSLVLGLLAWILPVISLSRRNNYDYKNWTRFSIASICFCAISLFLQILYSNHLVKIEDWSALADTSNVVAGISSLLLVVTILLNAISMIVYRKNA